MKKTVTYASAAVAALVATVAFMILGASPSFTTFNTSQFTNIISGTSSLIEIVSNAMVTNITDYGTATFQGATGGGIIGNPQGTNVESTLKSTNVYTQYEGGLGPVPTVTPNANLAGSGFAISTAVDPNPTSYMLRVKITWGTKLIVVHPITNLFHVTFPSTLVFVPKVIINNDDYYAAAFDPAEATVFQTNVTTTGYDIDITSAVQPGSPSGNDTYNFETVQ